jgi:flagellar capping protein FliD
MKEVYYCTLFALVASLVFIFHRKLEHMTIEEVDDKATKATDRITSLEDEYKALQQKLDSQEARMGAASSQAADAQAFLDSNLSE